MKISMNKLCAVFSNALDYVEAEQLGTSENHSLRVAALCIAAGKKLNYNADALSALAICAMLHDNALTERPLSYTDGALLKWNKILHCEAGQDNISWLPFKTNIAGLILYHHERGDGRGPFKKREGEIPLAAALISAADAIDTKFHLQRVPIGSLSGIREIIAEHAGRYSMQSAVNIMLEVLDKNLLIELRNESIVKTVESGLPGWEQDISDNIVVRAGSFIGRIIDYRSNTTPWHTRQVANRAWIMADYYGYGSREKNALFLAASMHDIGKLLTPVSAFNKPVRLDKDEARIIRKQAANAFNLVDEITVDDVSEERAANQNKSLKGSGYPRGGSYGASDFNSRLLACLDIYQAANEPRPYQEARSHIETMVMLYDMSTKDDIDAEIVRDIDDAMKGYPNLKVSSPLDPGFSQECK